MTLKVDDGRIRRRLAIRPFPPLPSANRAGTALMRVTHLNLLFTISIHNSITYQQRSFSWPTEKEGLPSADTKMY
jgi:hypothetical protein